LQSADINSEDDRQ